MLTEQAWALIRVTQTSGPSMWSTALQRKVTEDGQELSKLKDHCPGSSTAGPSYCFPVFLMSFVSEPFDFSLKFLVFLLLLCKGGIYRNGENL